MVRFTVIRSLLIVVIIAIMAKNNSVFAFNVINEDAYDKFWSVRRNVGENTEGHFFHARAGQRFFKIKLETMDVDFVIPGLEEPGMQYDLDFRLGHSPLSYYTINVRTTNTGEPEFEGIANSYNVVSINAFNFGGLSLKCDHRLLAMEGYQEYWAPDGYGGVYRAKRYNTFKYDETRIGVELQMQLFLSNYIGLYYSHKNIQGYELGEHIWEETEYNVSKPKDMMGMYLGFGFVIPITKFLQNYQNLDFSVDYDGFLMSYATGIAIPFGEHFNLKFDYRWFMKSLEDEYIDEFRYANLDGGKSYGITAAFWM